MRLFIKIPYMFFVLVAFSEFKASIVIGQDKQQSSSSRSFHLRCKPNKGFPQVTQLFGLIVRKLTIRKIQFILCLQIMMTGLI